ncbi:MAG: tetratricopeptide repeat protein [Ignavibacteria bacterium]|nr:tetratricopeptide repeat protein [Ignavibacteria bacterium]
MKTKILFSILILFIFSGILFSQSDHRMENEKNKEEDKNPAVIIPGLGNYSFKVSTKNKKAQQYFDQGLTLVYSFNHNEASRSFTMAAKLDPDLAMAYWGIAYALGPNINMPADNEQRKQAYTAINTAIKLSKNSSIKEKDYIYALSKRYAKDVDNVPQSVKNKEFSYAMKSVMTKYPKDLDAAVIYAESLMNLKPWQYWNEDGTPADGTEEIVSVLESVLKKNPKHPGANHYYIHAVEASNNPGRALPSAEVLKDLIPSAGHLVHMPAHIFFRVGDYSGASQSNIAAINADESYISRYKPEGIYPVMYYNHNINFLSVSKMMEGKYSDAVSAANKIAENVRPFLKDMLMLEGFFANPLLIYISFGKWDEIINIPAPDTSLHLYSAICYYAKALAYAETGNLELTRNSLNEFLHFKSLVPKDAYIGLTPADLILNMMQDIIFAKIALAEDKPENAFKLFEDAVAKENKVNYNEPPDYYPSVRLMLGSALFMNEKYEEAEKVFRDELKKYPHNGRGLFGLKESLTAQGKNSEAAEIEIQFQKAWKDAEVQLSMSNL